MRSSGEDGFKTKREFTLEFKRETVTLLDSNGRPQKQIVAEVGIQPSC